MSKQQFTYTPSITTRYTTAAGEQSPQSFTITVANDTDAAVTCGKFEFDLPIGAGGISRSGAGITFISSDSTWNTISHGDGTLTAWSTEGSPSLSAGWTVTFTVGRVNTGATPLQTSIAVTEWSGPGNTAVTARPLAVDLIASTMDITTFMANPPNVAPGGSSELSWKTTSRPTLTLSWVDQGSINSIDVSGSTSTVVTPSQQTTYTLQATEQGLPTRQAQVIVSVAIPARPAITSFVASPDMVIPGRTFTLSWNTTNTDGIRIDPLGYTSSNPTGKLANQTVTETTTFTLTATLGGDHPTQQSTAVTYLPQDYFYASPASPITEGEAVTLYWSVSNPTALSITATSDGTTITTIGSGLNSSDSMQVTPTVSPTTYKLEYEAPYGTAALSTTVTIGQVQILEYGPVNSSVSLRTAYATSRSIFQPICPALGFSVDFAYPGGAEPPGESLRA